MVQIIPRAQKFGSEFGKSFGVGVGKGFSERLNRLPEEKQRQEDLMLEQQSYDTLAQTFGKKFADVWKSAPVGGRTALLQHGLEAKQRGLDLENILGEIEEPEKEIKESEEVSEHKFKLKDFDKGITPREKTARQEKRYTANLPLFQESQKKKASQDMIKDEIEILEDLSPKIGAMERFNINPKTGDIIIPALASPEAQRFLKTVNDFTIQAKDSYGSRVTNFDLANFMRRLPTLANSEEGRRQILQQMSIINDINLSREQALHDVIDDYGGIRNIDYDQAETIAEKRSKPRVEELKKKMKEIGSEQDKAYNQEIKMIKGKAAKGMVTVELSTGEVGYVPASEVKSVIKEGGKVL